MYNKLVQEVRSYRKWHEPINHHNEAYKTAKLRRASVFVYIDLKIYISLIALYCNPRSNCKIDSGTIGMKSVQCELQRSSVNTLEW